MKLSLLISILCASLLPAVAVAAAFTPLAPIPGVDTSSNSISNYLNSVFSVIISIAAMLAVIMIVWHGFQYMTVEAVSGKHEAQLKLRDTIFGLLIIVLSWLILHVINPHLLDLNVLQNVSSVGSGAPASSSGSGSGSGSSTARPTSQNNNPPNAPAPDYITQGFSGSSCPSSTKSLDGKTSYGGGTKLPGTSSCDPNGTNDNIKICCMYKKTSDACSNPFLLGCGSPY